MITVLDRYVDDIYVYIAVELQETSKRVIPKCSYIIIGLYTRVQVM